MPAGASAGGAAATPARTKVLRKVRTPRARGAIDLRMDRWVMTLGEGGWLAGISI
jgi:hypothetical protein